MLTLIHRYYPWNQSHDLGLAADRSEVLCDQELINTNRCRSISIHRTSRNNQPLESRLSPMLLKTVHARGNECFNAVGPKLAGLG